MLGAVLRVAALRRRLDTLLAATLTLDLYAGAVLDGEHRRQHRHSSRRMAWLFAATLPLERALPRMLGDDLLRVPVTAPQILASRLPLS